MRVLTDQNLGPSASMTTDPIALGDGGAHKVLVTVNPANDTLGWTIMSNLSVENEGYYTYSAGGINNYGSTRDIHVNNLSGNRAFVVNLFGARFMKFFLLNVDAVSANQFTVDIYPIEAKR